MHNDVCNCEIKLILAYLHLRMGWITISEQESTGSDVHDSPRLVRPLPYHLPQPPMHWHTMRQRDGGLHSRRRLQRLRHESRHRRPHSHFRSPGVSMFVCVCLSLCVFLYCSLSLFSVSLFVFCCLTDCLSASLSVLLSVSLFLSLLVSLYISLCTANISCFALLLNFYANINWISFHCWLLRFYCFRL